MSRPPLGTPPPKKSLDVAKYALRDKIALPLVESHFYKAWSQRKQIKKLSLEQLSLVVSDRTVRW